ncbi:MAG: hypothetical protein LAT67_04520 [Balneolales bacterium]|nr:hypothetical protein [Balneolales bacterium]
MDLPSFGNALTEAPKGWSRARNLATLVKTRGQMSDVRINYKIDTNKGIRFLSGRLFLIARDFQSVDKHLNTKYARMDLPSFGNALTEAPKSWSRARNLATN